MIIENNLQNNSNKKNAIILSIGFVDIPYIVSIINKYNKVTVITSTNNLKFIKSISYDIEVITFDVNFLPHPLNYKCLILFFKIFFSIIKIKLQLREYNKDTNIYFLNDFSLPVFFGLYGIFKRNNNQIFFVKTIPYLFLNNSNHEHKRGNKHNFLLNFLSFILQTKLTEGIYAADSKANIPWLSAVGYKLSEKYKYTEIKPVNWNLINSSFIINIDDIRKGDILFIDTDYFTFPNINLDLTIMNISKYFNQNYSNKTILIKSHHSKFINTEFYFKKYLKTKFIYIKDFFPVELIIPHFKKIYFINSSSVLHFKKINKNSLYKLVEFNNDKSREEFHHFIKYLFDYDRLN